jgi:hypothetical protein
VVDPDPDEIQYWRDAFGVHLIGYPATPLEQPNRHLGLLSLLDGLAETIAQPSGESTRTANPSADQALALVRLSARLEDVTSIVANQEVIPIRVQIPRQYRRTHEFASYAFDGALYSDVLARFSGTFFVFGPPGAGKTFGALAHLRHLASTLMTKAIAPDVTWDSTTLPLYIQLRAYEGSLREQLAQQIPQGLEPEDLLRSDTFLVLDGLNEVPQTYLDDGSFAADLARLLSEREARSSSTLLIGRAIDDVALAEVQRFGLDRIDHSWLAEHLPPTVSPDLFGAAQRPIIYRIMSRMDIQWDTLQRPSDIYACYFEDLLHRLGEPLRSTALEALGAMAFDAVRAGEQSILYAEAVSRLARRHQDASALASRMLELEFFQPTSGSRVVLPHHSFLEYLAAIELARRESATPGTVTEVSSHRAWDYVVLFAASVSEGALRRSIIEQLVRIDLIVALRAVSYSGCDDPQVLADLLTAAGDLPLDGLAALNASAVLEQVPASPEHESALRELLAIGGPLSGAASALLLRLNGQSDVPAVIDVLVGQAHDYNSATSIARTLAPHMERDTSALLLDRLERLGNVQEVDWSAEEGFAISASSAAAEAIAQVPPSDVLGLLDPLSSTGFRLRVLASWLWQDESGPGFDANLVLLARGERSAIFPLYGRLRFRSTSYVDESKLDHELVSNLVAFLLGSSPDRWAASAVIVLGREWPSTRPLLARHLASVDGLARLALEIASDGSSVNAHARRVEAELASLLGRPESDWDLVDALDIDWTAFPDLLQRILCSDDPGAIKAVCSDLQGKALPVIEVGDLEGWLRRVASVFDEDNFAGFMLARTLARMTTPDDERAIAAAVDELQESARATVVRVVLPALSSISTDDLSSSTISLVLRDELAGDGGESWSEGVLATLATERFAERVLMPILSSELDERRRLTLATILDRIGRRHGRRYVRSDGRALG